MKKKIIIGSLIALGIIILLWTVSLSPPKFETVSVIQNQPQKQSADKVEVFLFHATQRCITCITIGRLAGETVNEYFQSELGNGRIEFREINIDLSENRELAEKFQASGSALFINAISNGKDNIVEDINVWRLTQNEIQFKSYLKQRIDNLLGK
jgi:thiol-disulfide isomerase/thioredoxin